MVRESPQAIARKMPWGGFADSFNRLTSGAQTGQSKVSIKLEVATSLCCSQTLCEQGKNGVR